MNRRYQEDWDRRAREDARGYAASHDYETEDVFVASGVRDGSMIMEFSGLDPETPHGSSLEIGCGPGRLMEYMGNHFDRVCGVDVSPEMTRQAAERMDNAGFGDRSSFLVGKGAGRIPTDEKFDLIYSFTVFQHIRRKHTHLYIREVKRLLKDEGVAVLHFVEPYGLRRRIQAAMHLDPLASDTLRFRYFLYGEVDKHCRRAGLVIDAHKKIDFYGLYRIKPAR